MPRRKRIDPLKFEMFDDGRITYEMVADLFETRQEFEEYARGGYNIWIQAQCSGDSSPPNYLSMRTLIGKRPKVKTKMPDDKSAIETKQFGLAKAFDRVKYNGETFWRITYDTGVVVLAPLPLFESMSFELDQVDTPKR